MIPLFRRGALSACAIGLLASCGGGGGGGDNGGTGGGGGNSPLQATFDTGALTFSAAAPFDLTPATQRINGTVRPTGSGTVTGTLYVIVEVPANSFFTVPEAQIDGADSGHAIVQVASPQQLGPGTHEGTFRVRLCLNSQNCSGNSEIRGSPHTVSVRYTIGDVLDADTVTPHVVLTDTPGSVILRARGLTATTTVSFGGVPASSVTYVNSTQLRVQYPALSAGSHPITLNSGGTTFNGALIAVAATGYSYAWLPHQAVPSFVSALVYDAERGAFVHSADGSGPAQLVRYQFSGGSWVRTGTADGSFITQLRMSHDGSRILALRPEPFTPARLLDLDPTTLATARDTTVGPNVWTFALANDGNYVLAKRFPGSGGHIPPDLFGSNDRTAIAVTRINFHSLEAVESGDGSRVAVFGDSRSVGLYDTATSTWTTVSSPAPAGTWDFPHTGSANFTGTRFASLSVVVDENFQPIGRAAVGFQNSILSANGSRLYVYDQDENNQGTPVGRLRTYDVNAATLPPSAGSPYRVLAETIQPIVIANNPNGVFTTSSPARMALALDGRAIIICGIAGCVVQPTPP
jgi:hypothetical protein